MKNAPNEGVPLFDVTPKEQAEWCTPCVSQENRTPSMTKSLRISLLSVRSHTRTHISNGERLSRTPEAGPRDTGDPNSAHTPSRLFQLAQFEPTFFPPAKTTLKEAGPSVSRDVLAKLNNTLECNLLDNRYVCKPLRCASRPARDDRRTPPGLSTTAPSGGSRTHNPFEDNPPYSLLCAARAAPIFR